MFSKFCVLFLHVILYVRQKHIEKREIKLKIVLRKKIFHHVNRKSKKEEETGATRPNIVLGAENQK